MFSRNNWLFYHWQPCIKAFLNFCAWLQLFLFIQNLLWVKITLIVTLNTILLEYILVIKEYIPWFLGNLSVFSKWSILDYVVIDKPVWGLTYGIFPLQKILFLLKNNPLMPMYLDCFFCLNTCCWFNWFFHRINPLFFLCCFTWIC